MNEKEKAEIPAEHRAALRIVAGVVARTLLRPPLDRTVIVPFLHGGEIVIELRAMSVVPGSIGDAVRINCVELLAARTPPDRAVELVHELLRRAMNRIGSDAFVTLADTRFVLTGEAFGGCDLRVSAGVYDAFYERFPDPDARDEHDPLYLDDEDPAYPEALASVEQARGIFLSGAISAALRRTSGDRRALRAETATSPARTDDT